MKYAIVGRVDPATPASLIDAALASSLRDPPCLINPPPSHAYSLFFVELITLRRLTRLSAILGVPPDVALTIALKNYQNNC